MHSFKEHRPERLALGSPPAEPLLWQEIKVAGKNLPIRSYCAVALLHNKLYLYGGLQMLKGSRSDFYELDLTRQPFSWRQLPQRGLTPGPRSRHCFHPHGDRLYLFGGVTSSVVGHSQGQIFCFDPKKGEWSRTASKDTPSLQSFGSAVVGNKLFVLCGIDLTNFRETNQVYSFCFQTKQWSVLCPHRDDCPVEPRSNFGCCRVGETVFGFGGKSGAARLNDLFSFCQKEGYARVQTANPPLARSGCSLSSYDGKLVLFGGMHDVTWQLDDLQVFSLSGKSWSGCHSSPRKSAREVAEQPCFNSEESPNYSRKKTATREQKEKTSINSPCRILGQQKRKQFLLRKKKLLGEFQVEEGRRAEFIVEEPQSQAMADAIKHIAQPSVAKKSSTRTRTTTSRFMEPLQAGLSCIEGKQPCARDGHSAVGWGDSLLVFGGDRHQMSFNDLFKLNLRQLS